MIDDDDMQWVKAQRPPVAPPDSETTKRARASLLAHAEKPRHLTSLSEPRTTSSRRRFNGLLKGHQRLAAAAAAAILVTAGVAAAVVGIPGTNYSGLALGVPPAQAQPLLDLASSVLEAPAPEGDATLVLHTNTFPNKSVGFTGADLYLDDGRYYYAETAAGLPDTAEQDFDLKSAIEAAASAAHDTPEAARAAFLEAISPLFAGDNLSDASHAKQDNRIWVAAIDALGAAYGRPEVLAGTLNVLATVEGVTVTPSSYQGQNVLEVSLAIAAYTVAASTPPSPEEIAKAPAAERPMLEKMAQASAAHVAGPTLQTLTIDGQTGALLLYQDMAEDAGVTVTYQVSRVNAADYGL